MVTIIPRFYYE